MSTPRPDPDHLLARLQQEDHRDRQGRLKIFFGASAGVGKTYAMLSAAQAEQARGRAVVIGVVETHGRADTALAAKGLPSLPARVVEHRDRSLTDFDLDAALAFGQSHPDALVLLDELAHSHVGDARHPKRWQDAQELLGAGVDVWTTMNVQHLESLNDIVNGITGVRVRETVPDRVFDQADEVVVVDLPPDELLMRLKAGKVYLPPQAERASANFFRKGNLLALRELTLRRAADRVDGEMRAWRGARGDEPVWPNREALLACVGDDAADEKVVRVCARLAARLELPWHAVHVETAPSRASPSDATPAMRVLELARDMGATTATLAAPDAARALVGYARMHNLARLVIGRTEGRNGRWPIWRKRLAERLAHEGGDFDVLQVGLAGAAVHPAHAISSPSARVAEGAAHKRIAWGGYLAAVAGCVATTALAMPLVDVLELSNIVMLFLLAVLGIALRFGRGPSVLAAFLGVALFDLCFVPPRFSLAVSDLEYLVTFAVMLAVALVIGQLTAGLKVQAHAAMEREQRVRSLYEMARDLSSALLAQQVAEIGARFLATEFDARSTLLVADDQDRLQAMPGGTAEVDPAVAQWAFDRGEPAGRGTGTLPSSQSLMLPLRAPMRLRGVLAFESAGARWLGPEQRRLLETCASLLAISLERIHYIDVAGATTVQIESERLRNSLLSAISHDLRNPLASLVGLSDTLGMAGPPLTAAQQDVASAIRESARRMSALVDNLLDMARLQAGAVKLRLAWQPLEEVVGSALRAAQGVLAGRDLRIELPDELPLLHLDAVLMERVFVNLLENAAKYTPPGSAVVIGAEADPAHVRCWVDDEGPGLPAGAEERLFEKFERGQRESATPGVGLGLAICRAIVQAHGGRITALTRPEGSGARFLIELPRGTPPADDGGPLS